MMPPGMMSTEQIYGTGYLGMMEMMQSFMDGVEGTSNEKTMAENLAATRVAQQKETALNTLQQMFPAATEAQLQAARRLRAGWRRLLLDSPLEQLAPG